MNHSPTSILKEKLKILTKSFAAGAFIGSGGAHENYYLFAIWLIFLIIAFTELNQPTT